MTSSMKLNSSPKEDMTVGRARIHRAAMDRPEDEVVLLGESVSQVRSSVYTGHIHQVQH